MPFSQPFDRIYITKSRPFWGGFLCVEKINSAPLSGAVEHSEIEGGELKALIYWDFLSLRHALSACLLPRHRKKLGFLHSTFMYT